MDTMLRRAFNQEDEALIHAMRTVYFMIKEDIGNVKYSSFIDFQITQGCAPLNNLASGGITGPIQ